MSLTRIKAILLQERFIMKRNMEIWFDLIFFSMISVLAFGLISKSLAGSARSSSSYYVLMGMLFWEVIRNTQYIVTVNSLWSVWSHNLSNIFITPISLFEYIAAYCLSSIRTCLIVFTMLAITAQIAFSFNVLDVGLVTLALTLINLMLFAWSVGLPLLGLIFRYGTRIQAVSWGSIFLFQPLCAVFFPLSVLPGPIQAVAKCFAPTWVMGAARDGLVGDPTKWGAFAMAFALNIVSLAVGYAVFNQLFHQSRVSGQFARNDA